MKRKLNILFFIYFLFNDGSLFCYTHRLSLPQEEKTFFDTVIQNKMLRIVCNFIKNALIAAYIAGVCDRIWMEYKFFGGLKNLFITSGPSREFAYDITGGDNTKITPFEKWIAIVKPEELILAFGKKTYMDRVIPKLSQLYNCQNYSSFARQLCVGILSLLLLKDGVVPMTDVIYYTA